MGIKQKFFALAGLVGFMLALVSGIGYYTAYKSLESSIESEMMVTVREQGEIVNGWMKAKMMSVQSAANIQTQLADQPQIARLQKVMSVAAHDEAVMDVSVGYEDGTFIAYKDGDITKELDPRTRDWYKDCKTSGKSAYTEPYVDGTTKELVVSLAAPFKNKSGAFAGAICEDVTLKALSDRAKKILYHGQGIGILIDNKSGKVLATAGNEEVMGPISKDEAIGPHFEEMKQKRNGFFFTKEDGKDYVFAYTTVEATGWLLGVAVEKDFVFAEVLSMRLIYGSISLVGLLITVLAFLKFSSRITNNIMALNGHMAELADGNLRLRDLEVDSNDELGAMADGFNKMSGSIRSLLGKITETANQVAASSEELTAGAQQSAEAATDVAQTIVDVAQGVEKQLDSVDGAKQTVDRVFADLTEVTGQAGQAADNSKQAKDAAERGGALMKSAVDRMGGIERSVLASADVVKKLGENSQQIGQIVETISSIAEQTNLLALNAAIEAARAGEAGRGFSVVAEEVRKLAEQSQVATEEIKQRIANIQGDTEAAVIAMEEGTLEVQQGTTAITEVGAQFTQILNMVSDIEGQVDAINNSIKTVSDDTTSIVTAMDEIDEVSRATSDHTGTISAAAEEQSASSQEIASASQALATLAGELQETVQKFKL